MKRQRVTASNDAQACADGPLPSVGERGSRGLRARGPSGVQHPVNNIRLGYLLPPAGRAQREGRGAARVEAARSDCLRLLLHGRLLHRLLLHGCPSQRHRGRGRGRRRERKDEVPVDQGPKLRGRFGQDALRSLLRGGSLAG